MDGYILITSLAVMILLGHAFAKLAEKIKLPEVTGMIIAGIVINLIARALGETHFTHDLVSNLQVVVTIALCFVSYILGTKFFIPKVKKHYKTILPVLGLQFLFVVGFTTLFFYVFKQDLKTALLIGAISAATAPAPIIEITHKHHAKGSLTNTLFSIVGLDNILGIGYFFFILFFVKNMDPQTSISVIEPFISIFASIGIGLLAGLVLVFFDRKVLCKYCDDEKYESYLTTLVGTVLLMTVGAQVLGKHIIGIELSPFIATFILGAVNTNSITKEKFIYESNVINGFVPPLTTAFFVIAGLELDITKLPTTIGLFAIVYVVTHAGGKYLGAFIGTRVSKSTKPEVKKYLPTAVLTQGGFEIALASVAQVLVPGSDILLIVLTSVLIFEFFAPLLLTKSLIKSGDGIEFERVVCAVE